MSPSATPATQRGAAPRGFKAGPSASPEAAQCHACHAKRRCRQAPRLPREITKCHDCHVKRRRMSPSATPATQRGAASRGVTAGPSASAEPAQSQRTTCATQNDGGCRQVPHLPRETLGSRVLVETHANYLAYLCDICLGIEHTS